MNQQEYLSALRAELDKRKVPRVQEIMADYHEHFTDALKTGKTEMQVVEKLGAPDLIAKAYETESIINHAKENSKDVPVGLVISSLGRVLILAPFNFIFMFIPAVVLFAMLAAGWSVAGGLGAAGFGILAFIPGTTAAAGTIWATIALLFAGMGTVGLAAMGVVVMFVITRGVATAVVSYLQWNLKFILQK
jgi:uncharacterized membrane protein